MGHSLGGAIASLLAIMIHRKSAKELGFSPDIVSAVAYGTPPCVSKELTESCAGYVTTVVMQVSDCISQCLYDLIRKKELYLCTSSDVCDSFSLTLYLSIICYATCFPFDFLYTG